MSTVLPPPGAIDVGGMLVERARADATPVLTAYAVLLLLVPSSLVVEPLGAAGSPANLFGLLLFGWWGMSRLVPDLSVMGPQPVRRAIGFFIMTIVLSYAAAALRGMDGVEQRAADRGLLTVIGATGAALVAADGILDRASLDRLLRRLTLIGSIMGVIAEVQNLTGVDIRPFYAWIPGLSFNGGYDFLFAGEVPRVASTAGHPIEFGVVMVLLLPFALHQALHAASDVARRRWFVVGFIALGIPLSVSRSAIVGLVGAGIVLVIAWPQLRSRRALMLLPVFLIGIRLIAPGTLGTLKSGFVQYGSDPSVQGRTQDYGLVGRYIREHPFFGRGFATFLPDRYILLDNQYIGGMIEIGLVGMAVLVGVFITAMVCASIAGRRCSDPAGRQLGHAFIASIVAAMFGMATFDALGFSMFTGLLFLLIGCAGAFWRITKEDPAVTMAAPVWAPDPS